MNDAAVPTKKKKTAIPDDAPMPHKYEAIEKDDGSIQYFEHVMRAGIHFRQRAVPPVATLLAVKPAKRASLYPQSASNLSQGSADAALYTSALHMQLLTQSTRVALGDCREEVEGSFSDFKVEEFSLNPTPDAIAKINANFEVLRSLGIGVVDGTFNSAASFFRIPPCSDVTGKTEKHLDLATYKNYYVHVFRLLSGKELDGTPCDYGEHGSVVAAGVASLKLLINFETEAAVVHAVAEDAGEVEKEETEEKQPGPEILLPIEALMAALSAHGVKLTFEPKLIPKLKYEQLKLLAAATKKLLVPPDAGKRKVVPCSPPLFLVSCPFLTR